MSGKTSGNPKTTRPLATSIQFCNDVQGTLLPFLLARARIDPAHAGSSIQVLMDVLGVVITMVVCNAVLGTVDPPQLEMRSAASALNGASPH